MTFPTQLNFLLQQFHANSFDFGRSEAQVIQHALGALTGEEKNVVKTFLEETLSSTSEPAALQQQWFASQADIRFADAAETAKFLAMVRDLI